VPNFAQKLVRWQRRHGRHELPWQGTRDPYRVWLSEVMLQQTQVASVIPYFGRFLRRFPDLAALAAASEDEVLQVWSGLGYYARGRNLLRAARLVAEAGAFPDTVDGIHALPGVGLSSAAAIAVFAFGRRAAILDGNVKRVLARCFAIEGEKKQRTLAQALLPARGIETYTQALMDLGATVCTRSNPACGRCPVARDCVAQRDGRIDELPAARKRRPLPLKRSTWLVLLHQGTVLLERRPSTGIWGGLWAFPELVSGAPEAFCRNALGCEVGKPRRLTTLEHGFTHFRLRVRPLRCAVSKILPRAEAPGRIWLDLEDAARAAVPAPVRRLLLDFGGQARKRAGFQHGS
jgi:A/G-specific adenine glycosylase